MVTAWLWPVRPKLMNIPLLCLLPYYDAAMRLGSCCLSLWVTLTILRCMLVNLRAGWTCVHMRMLWPLDAPVRVVSFVLVTILCSMRVVLVVLVNLCLGRGLRLTCSLLGWLRLVAWIG